MKGVTLSDIKPEYRREPGAAALVRLLNRCSAPSDGTVPIVEGLRSMHNGVLYPVDLERVVKRLDREPFFELLEVMRFYHEVLWPRMELCNAFTDDRTFKRHLFPGCDVV
jgi:hypothetical protein